MSGSCVGGCVGGLPEFESGVKYCGNDVDCWPVACAVLLKLAGGADAAGRPVLKLAGGADAAGRPVLC